MEKNEKKNNNLDNEINNNNIFYFNTFPKNDNNMNFNNGKLNQTTLCCENIDTQTFILKDLHQFHLILKVLFFQISKS